MRLLGMGNANTLGMWQVVFQIFIKVFIAGFRGKALTATLQILLLLGFLAAGSTGFAQNLIPLREWSVSLNGTNNDLHRLYPENSIHIKFDVIPLNSSQSQQSFLDVEADAKSVSVRYVLYASESDLKNPIKLLKYFLVMQSISGKDSGDQSNLFYVSQGRLTVAEILANIKAGSSTAELSLQNMYISSLKELTKLNPIYEITQKMTPGTTAENFPTLVEKEILDTEKRIKILADKEAQEFQQKALAWSESVKSIENDKKLPRQMIAMIKRNDRKGFAQIIKSVIPWQLLEPSEKSTWSQWIESIEVPSKKNLIVVYRGFQGASEDPLQAYQRAARMKSIKSFTGFWRLKLKERDPQRNHQLGGAQPAINSELHSHASNSEKSPFVSFTSDFQTASMFAEPNVVVAKVDPRRIIVNLNNPRESEFLVPLVLFPDEVSQLLTAMTEKELTDENRKTVPQDFNRLGMRQLQELIQARDKSNKCSNLFH